MKKLGTKGPLLLSLLQFERMTLSFSLFMIWILIEWINMLTNYYKRDSLSLGLQRVQLGVKDLQKWFKSRQNPPCIVTDLLKTSKQSLLDLAENNIRNTKKMKNFYQTFSIIFYANKGKFWGFLETFKGC
jgi:hypothetical protein